MTVDNFDEGPDAAFVCWQIFTFEAKSAKQ